MQISQLSPLRDKYFSIILLIILLVTLVRITYLIFSPFDLSPDEMYYWEWSRRLDYGYFSKPPLIAWIIWASTKIFGNTEFGVRFPAIVFSTLSLIIIVKLLAEIYDIKTALHGLVLTISIPATVLLSFIMTIDSPLVFFWLLSLYLFYHAIDKNSFIYWALLGISLGLGLLSKQTMIMFYPCKLLYLVARRNVIKLQSLQGIFISILISFLIFLPVIIWNFRHDFVTFIHTTEHFTKREYSSLVNALSNFISFMASQAILLSPFIFVFCTYYSIKYLFNNDDKKFFFACFSAPLIIFVFLLSLVKPVNANWPAPFYIASLFIIAPMFTKENFHIIKRISIITGFILVLSFYSIHLLLNLFGLENTRFDITKKLKNHRKFVEAVHDFLKSHEITSDILLASTRRMYVSALSFYLPGNPYVLRWSEKPFPTTQYEIWNMWDDKEGKDILFILDKKEKISPLMLKSFDSINNLGSISVDGKVFNIYYAKNYRKVI